jgi:hypothetical protein
MEKGVDEAWGGEGMEESRERRETAMSAWRLL